MYPIDLHYIFHMYILSIIIIHQFSLSLSFSLPLLSPGKDKGYWYAKSHEWALVENNIATIGISNYAQVWQIANYV